MTVDDWPIICQHSKCKGTATPATMKYMYATMFGRYYCQQHAQELFNSGLNNPDKWVQLTPNQRPNQVQEAHNGND